MEHTYIDKVQLEWIDLSKQRNATIIKPSVFYIYDTYFRYTGEFLADEPQTDEEGNVIDYLEWERNHVLFDISAARKSIVGIDLFNGENFFKIIISVNGKADDLQLFFKRYGEARDLYLKLIAYAYF